MRRIGQTLIIFICLFSSFVTAKDIDNYLDLAVLFKENGQYHKAIEVLEAVYSKGADDRVSRYIGKCYYLKGEAETALDFLNKIKEKTWYDYFYLGLTYEDLGKQTIAENNYLKSVKIKKSSIALYRLAKINFARGEYKGAVKNFLEVISLDSSIRLTYYYLGICYLNLENFPQAYKYLVKAVNFYPENLEVKEKLSIVKRKLGQDFFVKKEKDKAEARRAAEFSAYSRQKDIPSIKVAIAEDLREFTFKNNGKFMIRDKNKTFTAQKDKFYTIILEDKLTLRDYETDSVYEEFSGPLKIYVEGEDYPFYILNLVYGEGNFWHKKRDMAYRGDLEVRVNNNKLTVVNLVSLEEYLYGVLSAEIPASSQQPVLKAQAVAARTIAFKSLGRHKKGGFDFCADVHCQVYKGFCAESPKTTQAVKDTRGQIIVYNGKPIEAFYHANCGGCLCSDVFGARDYLVNKLDWQGHHDLSNFSPFQEEEWFYERKEAFCESGRGSFRWQRVYDEQDFNLAFGFTLSSLKYILLLDKGDCFHYSKVAIAASQELILDQGLKIRNYFDKLRSSAFKLEEKFSLSDQRQMLLFWGAGFGHGTGLCQEGAIKQAKEGYSYKEILRHYYPSTQVKAVY
ncbi:MAG: SpoIID/LytB domain-containing protein [Candidatus Omnitrophota bacterium]|nr:MAG: SpoIID/LytB domain-containing protein [Candidatus Omnitrophota bacterium]